MSQPDQTVNITMARYIELLEAEVAALKLRYLAPPAPVSSLDHLFSDPPIYKARLTPKEIPTAQGRAINGQFCVMHDITRAIHARGITVKAWAIKHGFDPVKVRMVICGSRKCAEINAALDADGLLEK